jgi:Ca2+-binding RTX toxin-like protein
MAILPNFSTATFEPGAKVDNPYFPLTPGTQTTFAARTIDEETGEVTRQDQKTLVTYNNKTILGVNAVTVQDTAWENGNVKENTLDWYAQDTQGNVWYLGEFATNYEYDEQGHLIGIDNAGSWEAGVNKALPGFIMEANPNVGDRYYQEFAPNNQAIDQGQVLGVNQSIKIPLGQYSDVISILDTNPLDPNSRDLKFYAPGVGEILVKDGLDENLKNPEAIVRLKNIETLSKQDLASEVGTQGNDVLNGNNRANFLRGNHGNDLLQAQGGSDRLKGEQGHDLLVGGDGADTLCGGNGNDILIGGSGKDDLHGGQGKDQFIFTTLSDGVDQIRDFNVNRDVIGLTMLFDSSAYGSPDPFGDYIQLVQQGTSTAIRIDPDGDLGTNPFQTLAILQNTKVETLSDRNFVI